MGHSTYRININPQPLLLHLFGVTAFMLSFILIVFPKASIGFFIFFSLLLLIATSQNIRLIQKEFKIGKIEILLFALSIFFLINSLLAVGPLFSIKTCFRILSIIVLTLVSIRLITLLDRDTLKHITFYVCIGAICGTIWLVTELLFGKLTTIFVYSNIAMDTNTVADRGVVEDNILKDFNSVIYNKHAGSLTLILFPILLLVQSRFPSKLYVGLSLLIITLALIAVLTSQNETSKIAILAGLTIFLISTHFGRAIHIAITGLLCITLVAAIPLFTLPLKYNLDEVSWIQYSAKDRFHIWNHTASKAAERPLIGFGLDTARYFSRQNIKKKLDTMDNQTPDSSKFRPRFSSHAHNAFLQIRFDLGVIGSLLFASLICVISMLIVQLDKNMKPATYAFCGSLYFILFSGWGIWQTWLWSSICCATLLFVCARAYNEKKTISV